MSYKRPVDYLACPCCRWGVCILSTHDWCPEHDCEGGDCPGDCDVACAVWEEGEEADCVRCGCLVSVSADGEDAHAVLVCVPETCVCPRCAA
jgi:hypothetical protein